MALHRASLIAATAVLAAAAGTAEAQTKSADQQIAAAVSPLPEGLRAGAEVRALIEGALVTVRDGSNEMICLADDPTRQGFHAACYHRDLEPFMARGRELRAEGRTRPEIDSIRLAEIDSGTLEIPSRPTALYSLSSDSAAWDEAAGMPADASGLYVIYLPYATAKSSGISVQPARDRPWLMYPGKPWAHVMISR
jgi:hypothetical protein